MKDLFSPSQLARFVWAERRYLLLLPLAMLFGTLFHEAAHALAAALQGAKLTKLSLLPSWSESGAFRFGYVSYRPPIKGTFHEDLVLLAPVFAWTMLATYTALSPPKPTPRWRAKGALIFLYFLPLGDVSMQLHGLFFGLRESDLFRALHGQESAVALLAVFYFVGFAVAGYRLFRLAYGDALRRAEFAVGYLIVIGAAWLLRP